MSVYIDVDEIELTGPDYGPPYYIDEIGSEDTYGWGSRVMHGERRFVPGVRKVAEEFGLTAHQADEILMIRGKLDSIDKVKEFTQKAFTSLRISNRWGHTCILGPTIVLLGHGSKGTKIMVCVEECHRIKPEKLRALQIERSKKILSDSVSRIV